MTRTDNGRRVPVTHDEGSTSAPRNPRRCAHSRSPLLLAAAGMALLASLHDRLDARTAQLDAQ